MAFPSSWGAVDLASFGQRLQRLAQTFVLDRELVTELGSRQHRARKQQSQHLRLEIAALLVMDLSDDLQVSLLRIGRDQFQMDRWRSRRRAVFVGEHQALVGAAQIPAHSLKTPMRRPSLC